tara:strand:- start:13839 stop:14015 length:177 start_codon:yes stop_codon:yes gene_type:complete
MIKFIVKYKTQKWVGDKYIYPEITKIMTFKKLEDVTNENIQTIHKGWVEILDLKQVLV